MPATTQAVILARGLGTRMRRADSGASLNAAQLAAADAGAKGMIPFDRPFLDYLLLALADAGITDVVLVIGPEHETIRSHFTGPGRPDRLRVRFATQASPKGTADAVLAARAAVGDQPFLTLNSDNYYPPAAIRALAALGASGLVAFDADTLVRESGIEPDRVLRYALVDFDNAGWLRAIIEKPGRDHPLAMRAERWVSMNLWSFTSRIFDACARVTTSARGELELQSAVTIAMRDLGEGFRVIAERAAVLDLSDRGDLAVVAQRLPRRLPHRPAAIARYVVPGRVELVGKHVDYAGGRSLTCAIEAAVHITAHPSADQALRVRDHTRRTQVVVPLAADATWHGPTWGAYVAAVARRMVRDFPGVTRGIDVTLRSDLPPSAGLSSSSAIVVGLGMALADANDLDDDPAWRAAVPTPIARAEYFAAIETGAPYGDFAGDEGVGVRGGAQDHVAILCARRGEVGQFRYLPPTLERYVPYPADCVLAIAVSGVHAAKAGNARAPYNRLSDAMRAFAAGLPWSASAEMDERIAQFREESDVIVPGVADAMLVRDFSAIGALVDRSQWLAERILGNQVAETILLARAARERGAIAASAFGAGFGGAVWAMVRTVDAETFVDLWRADYERAFPARRGRARWLRTRPAGPAARMAAE